MPQTALAVPALAWGTTPRYPADFTHFDYVNPLAPKGGSVNLDGFGSFDKLNPYTLKGTAAAGLGQLMFETLAEGSEDEPFSMYALIARDMELAPDELSITFRIDPRARFWNGDPVLATDVKHSFDTLTSKLGHPAMRQYYADVARAVVVDPLTVRFEFKRRNHELHLILGMQLPIFSHKWGAPRPFNEVVLDEPITSGPYRVERFDLGRSIRFRRNPQYWARDLPTRRGMFNFDRITYKYFRDETARLEGFKAGVFDWIAENSARNWARGHTGRRYASGELIKREFKHANGAGLQGFALNTRRAQFADRRVRQALGLAFDFEWMNRQIFYGQYVRSRSYFTNSEMEAKGLPSAAELALLEPLRGKLDPAVFGEAPLPADTVPPRSLRANLRQARELLQQAGWRVADDGVLRNAAGEPFEFEILNYSKAFERVAEPWARNLEKLGIRARLRVTDLALYQKRIDAFDFDVVVHAYGASQTPGNELLDRFSTHAAAETGSENVAGVRDPAVDVLIARLLESRTRAELVAVAGALDRVLRHGYYLVPHFYSTTHRVAYWRGLTYPEKLPLYYGAAAWMVKTWWMRPGAAPR